MRLTVLGTGTARPTAGAVTSGLLIQSGTTNLLLDCGTGIAARLDAALPAESLSAIAITHLHADHALDLAALRYRFPWAGGPERRIPLHIPRGSGSAIAAMSAAIAERPGFIEEAFEVREYEPEGRFVVGELRLDVVPAQHYVTAGSFAVTDPSGARLVYAGDTGPTARIVDFARGADLLVIEATLGSPAEDDERRGHLTGDEAIEIGRAAAAAMTLLVHYPAERSDALEAACAVAGSAAQVAHDGMTLDVVRDQGSARAPRLGRLSAQQDA